MSHRPPKIVVLGMLTKMPVAGVAWQTLHYLLGFERLGYDVFYVEAHARTPSMLMEREEDDGSQRAADYLGAMLGRFGLAGRWAFHALHDDGRCFGLSHGELKRLYEDAALIVNLHGGTQPLPEHAATGRLVYVETDPVLLQIELHDGLQETIDFLEPHSAFFTFGENIGSPDCGLPDSTRFRFHPTRQPVVLDLWPQTSEMRPTFTTIGNWRQIWRPVTFRGQTYSWSKHHEFLKMLELPERTGHEFELALSSYEPADRELLEQHRWRVRHGLDVSIDIDVYRHYISSSQAEFTVAKDQNIRLRSGWFSDRSATYLAAGRPVVTQETGFSNVLPTGEGLFAFSTVEEAAAAVNAVAGSYAHHSEAALEVARECFDSDVVLRRLLDDLGEVAPTRTGRAGHTATSLPLPVDLVLTPISKRPTVLPEPTVERVLSGRLPSASPVHADAPRVSIVIVTYNNLVFTRMCLETVAATTPDDVEVIVVDNGSSDGTPGYLTEMADRVARVHLLLNKDNRGFPRANNQGLAVARGEVLVLLNNDTIVPPRWLEALAGHLEDPAVGLVGPVTNAAPNEARIDTDYSTYGELLSFAEDRRDPRETFDIPVATMFCAAMRWSTYATVGGLDESFGMGMFEDDDYAERVRQAGLRVVCAPDVFVHHFGEASFGNLVPTGAHGELFRANQQRFEQKWGRAWTPHARGHGGDYAEMVAAVKEVVLTHTPPHSTVLVFSKGDDDLINFEARRGLHFPQDASGQFPGHYPANDEAAVSHLEELQTLEEPGFVVVPRTSMWWLQHYPGLRRQLEQGYERVADVPSCHVYALRTDEVN